MDGNLSSNRAVEQKINLLEDCLKALMKPWSFGEVDSTEDQQSTTDYVMETTHYRQSDETGDEIDNFGVEETTESISSELGEIVSAVLRNTWLTESMHEDVHDADIHEIPTTKVVHMSNRQESTSASDELMETEMNQIKPGFSAILDSILTQSANDYTLNLGNYEPPFAVEFISKDEARRRRWLRPRKQQQDSTMHMPRVYECEWGVKGASHSNVPETNVYYCMECQRRAEEETCFKTFAEKSSPRRKLAEFNHIAKLLGKDEMNQCSFKQAEKIINEESNRNMCADVRRPKTCDIEGPSKSNDRVLSDYQEQLICGHINYLNTVKDCATSTGEKACEMRWRSRPCCIEQKSLPEKISKYGLYKNLRDVSREFQKETQNCENGINDYDIDNKERRLLKENLNYPPSILFEKKGPTTPPFDDDHGAHFCSHILPETNSLESDSLQLDPCRDYSPASGNFAFKCDVTEVTNGKEVSNISSLPVTCSNNNQPHEEIDEVAVCSHVSM